MQKPGNSQKPTDHKYDLCDDEPKLRRRSVLNVILAFIGGSLVTFGTGPASATVTEQELEPFKKIAREKGFKFTFKRGKKVSALVESEMHLDMDMVRASLKNAIERAKQKHLARIQERLERLLASGTAAQQVDFVLGSGSRYFFPEDIEALAAKAEKDKFQTFGVVCDTFCWVSCICTQNAQECRERCRDIFCPST